MTGALVRLKEIALRPLWTESELHRARRRCRSLVALPFSALAGLVWGTLSAPALAGSPLAWGALGAFSFSFLMWLEQRVVPPLAEAAARSRPGGSSFPAGFWESAVVGGFMYLITSVLGAPVVPAVGTALGVGAAYAFVVEYLLCGSAASGIATLLQGASGSWTRASDGHSRADALVQQGRWDEAEALYLEALRARPRDAHTYVRLARLHVTRGAPQDAVETLRRAVRRADMSAAEEGFVVRQIYEVCATKLKDARRAHEDVAALLERRPEGPHVLWAESALRPDEDEPSGLPPVGGRSD